MNENHRRINGKQGKLIENQSQCWPLANLPDPHPTPTGGGGGIHRPTPTTTGAGVVGQGGWKINKNQWKSMENE